METEGDLQSLIIHRASLLLELQITEPILLFQSAELLQEHHTKFTLVLNNPAVPSTATCEVFILMPKSLVSNAFRNGCMMKHTPDDLSPINFKLKSAIFI